MRLRKRCGLRAARDPQDRRAAPRPPLGPHCIRGKKLRGDIPLLLALPAHPGCDRDIASPLHGARLSRPTCPPTAADRPSERATDRPLPPPAGQQQAPARPGPTPLNGRLQPPVSRAWREIGDAARRSVLSSTPTGGNACPSLFSPSEPAFFLGPHWLRPLACPAPGGLPVPRRGCANRTEPAGGRGLEGAWERRPAPAKLGFRHEPTGCSLRPPKRLGQRARARLSVAAGASVPDS